MLFLISQPRSGTDKQRDKAHFSVRQSVQVHRWVLRLRRCQPASHTGSRRKSQRPQWNGKIVVDVTNALEVAPEEMGGLLSSEIVAKAFVGARLVKAFNHLPAAQLGTNPPLEGQQQVVFVSSNDADASAIVAAVATQLGFAPIELGRLDQGGVPLHAVDGEPGGLLFQNVEKLIGQNYE